MTPTLGQFLNHMSFMSYEWIQITAVPFSRSSALRFISFWALLANGHWKTAWALTAAVSYYLLEPILISDFVLSFPFAKLLCLNLDAGTKPTFDTTAVPT